MNEWASRLESSVEFYQKLPDKTCQECGQHMNEQCESYETTCASCTEKLQLAE